MSLREYARQFLERRGFGMIGPDGVLDTLFAVGVEIKLYRRGGYVKVAESEGEINSILATPECVYYAGKDRAVRKIGEGSFPKWKAVEAGVEATSLCSTRDGVYYAAGSEVFELEGQTVASGRGPITSLFAAPEGIYYIEGRAVHKVGREGAVFEAEERLDYFSADASGAYGISKLGKSFQFREGVGDRWVLTGTGDGEEWDSIFTGTGGGFRPCTKAPTALLQELGVI